MSSSSARPVASSMVVNALTSAAGDESREAVGGQGAGGRENGDTSRLRLRRRRFDARFHADDRKVREVHTQGTDARRRRRVARDDDRAAAGAAHEVMPDGEREIADFVAGTGTVGDMRGIADVNDALGGALPQNLANDGQTAQTGIENADRSIGLRLRRRSHGLPVPCVAASPPPALSTPLTAASEIADCGTDKGSVRLWFPPSESIFLPSTRN